MENEIEIAGVIRVILGLNLDSGKENGNYNIGFRIYGLGFRL